MKSRKLAAALSLVLAATLLAPAAFGRSLAGKRTLTGPIGDPDGDTMISVGKRFYELRGDAFRGLLFQVAQDAFLKGNKPTIVTVHGDVKRGSFGVSEVDVDWVLATAKKKLDVKVYPKDDAAANTFTNVPAGDSVEILSLRGDWAQIQHVGGPVDGYAFVKLAELEIGHTR